MTLFADTPRWSRHGMLWGHLVSDASLAELHDGAARAGLPGRAFDLDHYDWPDGSQEDLRAVGTRFVPAGELTRRLIASGLRVPLRDRPGARWERSRADAARLGLDPLPEGLRDLVLGRIGHADPLPVPAPPGSFRLGQEDPAGPPRIEAPDGAGRAAAAGLLARLDGLARAGGAPGFVGQLLVVPEGSVPPGS